MKKILLIFFVLIITNAYSQNRISMSLDSFALNITSAGNVGIGTTTPTSLLHLYKSKPNYSLFKISADANATKDSTIIITNKGTMIIGDSSIIKISTINPVTPALQTIVGGIPLRLLNPNAVGYTSIKWSSKTSADTIADYAQILGGVVDNTFGAQKGFIELKTYNNGIQQTNQFIMDNAGTVFIGDSTSNNLTILKPDFIGIGTKTPAAALHIKGAEQIGNVNTLIADSVNALRLSGTATVWDDLMFPFSTGHQGNANYPPFNADSLYFEFGIDSTGADAQFMYFIIQMPHSWKEGSTIYPHVHYKYESGVGACSFKMKYKWYNIGASTEIGWNWANMNISNGSTNNTHVLASTYAGISGAGKTISSILICKVYLYGVAGTGTCKAYQFDIHYEKDALGSNTETQKN